MGAVRAGSHLRFLTVIHSVTCGSLLSLDVSGVLFAFLAQLASRNASWYLASTVQRRLLDVFVVQDYSSHSPPVTRAGCFNSAFFAYLPAKT